MLEIECNVYRSLKKADTYVFIPNTSTLDNLPNELKIVLGKTELSMTLLITEDKKMARGTGAEILKSIEEQGFYLQMSENPQLIENPLAKSNERFLDKDM